MVNYDDRMKIRKDHFERLAELVETAHSPDLMLKYREAGHSPKRYRWDLFWAIPREHRLPLVDELYRYIDDDNIDSALRKITKTGHRWRA